jgi:hypothetical protein
METTMPICRIALFLGLLFLLPPLAECASDDQVVEIVVKKGESLYHICELFLENPQDWRQVASVNRLKNPEMIHPGQKLVIPVRLLRGVPVDGVVTFITGDVSIKEKQTQAWRSLHLNEKVVQGNWVQTGPNGAVEITFENEFTVFLRPDTVVEISAARKKGALFLLYRLFLSAGKTISRLQQITGKESRYEIRTPSAVAAPRGTEFRTAVDSDVNTRLEVLAGEVGVRAAKKAVDIKTGEGTLVKKGLPPAAPRKLLPAPDLIDFQPLYRTLPLEFRLGKVAGARSYRIMIARDQAFKDVVVDRVLGLQESPRIIGIDDGSYYLQTRSIDDIGLEGISSTPKEVKVRVNPLPPFIQSPDDGAEYREKTVLLTWLEVKQAVKYHVQVAKDPAFAKIVEDVPVMSGTSRQTGNLDYKTYYFHVRSIAADGYQGVWSDTLRFTIVPPPPSPPLEKPEMGDKELRIRWQRLGNGTTYHFQMAKDDKFETVLTDEKLAEPEITLDKPHEPGTYYVRTSSIDADGYEGEFSEPQTFNVLSDYRYVPLGFITIFALLLIVL